MTKTSKHILVIEDARDMQMILRSALEDLYKLTFAESIGDGERFLNGGNFDLILLDVMLPDGTGFDLAERIKTTTGVKKIPLIFLTGQTEVAQRVRGIKLGAEDYISKPFAPEELLARIESQIARAEAQSQIQSSFRASCFEIDTSTQTVLLRQPGEDERKLELTRIEFKFLVQFVRHPGQIFSRADLIKKVWGESTHVSEHTVDTHISSLRKKIGRGSGEIKAVVKRGYLFEPLKI